MGRLVARCGASSREALLAWLVRQQLAEWILANPQLARYMSPSFEPRAEIRDMVWTTVGGAGGNATFTIATYYDDAPPLEEPIDPLRLESELEEP